MLLLDPYSKWLGMEILSVEIGTRKLGMTIRAEMLNSMEKPTAGITCFTH
jgi:acyl-CoA thioesterase